MTTFIRGVHKGDYTLLSNKTLRDESLSWKARGLLAYLLSHSEGYHIRADNLHESSSDGPFATASAVKELKRSGYICFYKHQNSKTKAWEAGHWVVSEEAELPKSLPPGKPASGKPGVRETVTQGNRAAFKKDQLKEDQLKEETKAKKDLSRKSSDRFDPEELGLHLGKHPEVVKAWLMFVQHRIDKKKPLTIGSYTLLINKMLQHSPEEIVEELHKSIECGWPSIFYNDTKQSVQKSPHNLPSLSRSVVSLTPDGQLLMDFVCSVLGNDTVRPNQIQSVVDQMVAYHKHLGTIHNERCPERELWHDQTPIDHLGWRKFFDDWLDFLRKKQDSGFVLLNVRNLEQSNPRWQEYIKECECFTGWNFAIGKRRE